MSVSAKDITAVEMLNAKLAAALNEGEISSISDLAAPQAFVLPPAQSVFKGPRVYDVWRGMAIRYDGVKFMTTDLEPLGGDALLEVGTFSARPKKEGEDRIFFKYQFVWQRIDGDWKLASMVWNRPAPARAPGRRPGGQTEQTM